MRCVCVDFVIFIFIVCQVKKSFVMIEKVWKGCGQKVGVKIWRIVKFKVSIYFMLVLYLDVFNNSVINFGNSYKCICLQIFVFVNVIVG